MNDKREFFKNTYDLTDYQLKKYEAMFDCLDSGKDGFLDFADFVPHVNHIKKAKEWEENGEHFLQMMNAKASFWLVLCYIEDAILENRIDKMQWFHFWGEMADAVCQGKTYHFGRTALKVKKDKAPGWTTIIMHSLFKILDANSSGVISEKEYRLYLESIGVNLGDSEFKSVWNNITRNKPDQGLRIDEMEELLIQWLVNGDETDKAPGDYFPSGGQGI